MNDAIKLFLREIRSASQSCDDDPHSIIKQYDMIFAGKNFNTVNSLEIRHSLQKVRGIEISNEELNSMLPSICSELGIKLDPMVALNSTSKETVACYQLTLW